MGSLSSVLCLGEALIDRLGPPGGDPANDSPVEDCLGGAPANVACGLARLGTAVSFFGRLGEDPIGNRFAALFQQRGVDCGALQWDALRPTRIVLVRRSQDGERQFQGFAGDQGLGFADQALGPVNLPQGARGLLGHHSAGNCYICIDAEGRLVQARQHQMSIALDVNWRPTFWDPDADPAAGPSTDALAMIRPLEQAALIKLALEEAIWLFGPTDPQAISAQLPQGPDVVVTDGAEPVRVIGASGMQPAFQPPQVDTTGAGDAFTAGLLHRWAAAPADRIRFAAACGALVCGGAGGIDPQPTEAQVEVFLGGVI